MKHKDISKLIAITLAACMLLTSCQGGSRKRERDRDKDEDEEEIELTESRETKTEESDISQSEEYSGLVFNTTDIYGTEYSDQYFRDHELTIVNIWGTYCGPCISEMPELEELYNGELAELNVGLIGIPCDVYDSQTTETCVELVEDLGVTFPILVMDDALLNAYVAQASVVPTTFIVNSNGEVVAGPIEGSYPDQYMEAVYANLG